MKLAKWLGVHFLLALLLFLASWTRFPNILFGVVDYIELPFFALADYAIAQKLHPDLRLIYIAEKKKGDFWYFGGKDDRSDRQEWRERHAKLLRGLTDAGAKIVAFDLAFPDTSEEHDPELAQAIRYAIDRQLRVIVGFDPGRSRVSEQLEAVLKSDQLASIEVVRELGGFGGSRLRRHIVLAKANPHPVAGQTLLRYEPTFPLLIKLTWEGIKRSKRVRARLDIEASQLVLQAGPERLGTVPCHVQSEGEGRWSGSVILQRSEEEYLDDVSHPYDLIYEWPPTELRRRYQGTIVLVGAQVEDEEKFQIGPTDSLYGYQVHASVVSNLLQGIYPHEAGIPAQFLLLFLLGLVAGGSRATFPAGHRPVTIPLWGRQQTFPLTLVILFLLYLLVAVLTYAHAQVVPDFAYQTLALVAGYYVTGWLLLRPSRPIAESSEPAEESKGKEENREDSE